VAKVLNPLQNSIEKVFNKYSSTAEKMFFTDITSYNDGVLTIRENILCSEEITVTSYVNDITGGVSLLFEIQDVDAIALWNEINSGELAIMSISALSMSELIKAFLAVKTSHPTELAPI
jgi:hypothetical protein